MMENFQQISVNKDEVKEIKTYDIMADTIYKTNDYSKFKLVKGNRHLNRSKCTSLIASMKEKQLEIPIIVNEKLEIIDGQHRFFAARELNKPVFYVMKFGYTIDDVKRANLVLSKWTTEDYLNMHIASENEKYIQFESLMVKYNMSLYNLMKILSLANNETEAKTLLDFKDGELNLENIQKVEEFCIALSDFDFFPESRSKSFICAFSSLFFNDKYKHEQMQRVLKKRQQLLFDSNKSKSEYLYTLSTLIYSSQTRYKNNIYYDKYRGAFYYNMAEGN